MYAIGTLLNESGAITVTHFFSRHNVDFPENLTLQVENVDNKLVLIFQSQGNMKKLIATVDEVLEHVQIALKVIE